MLAAPMMVHTVAERLAQPPTFRPAPERMVTDGPLGVKFSSMATVSRSPDLSQEDVRIASFHGWPLNAPIPAKRLAQGGFVYAGHDYHTRCFQCGLEIGDWKIADEVVKRHRQARPDCAFVRSLPAPASAAQSPVSATTTPPSFDNTRHSTPMQVDCRTQPRVGIAPGVHTPASSQVLKENDLLLHRLQASEEERFNTFSDWPLDYLSPRLLAQAGFYYLHEQDKVRCAFCRGTVHNWERGDDPLREHARHYPCCPFLLDPSLAGQDECGHESRHRSRSVPEGRHLLIGANGSQGVQLKGDTPPSELSGLGVSVHVGPKHPSQASPDARLRTFEKWPSTCAKRPLELVQAGFFYIGVQDYTKCFHCDGGLCNWDSGDDPWEEHARWFPRCQFVLLAKGEAYINDCLRRHQSHLNSVAASTSSQQGQTGAADEGMATELAALMRSDDVQFYLSQGVPAETLRAALLRHMRGQGRGFASRDELLQVLGELLALPKASADQTPQERATNGASSKNIFSGAGKQSSPVAVTPAGSEPSDPEETRLKDQRLCKVCLDAEVGVVFLPCGHLVACPSCASALVDCPICRAAIRGTVRTFFA
ncbi:baculoviral IAP repeat-containing protein 7-like isoform X1 [Amblyomma americanum]